MIKVIFTIGYYIYQNLNIIVENLVQTHSQILQVIILTKIQNNMYESPIKALTEKILEAELYEEHKDDFDQVDDLSKNNISGFWNLKKRSSVNNKIANIRNDSTGTINIDDSKSNYLYCKEDDKPSINLPMVKQEGKQFISTESRTDSYTKLEIKYSKETEGSITGLRYPSN